MASREASFRNCGSLNLVTRPSLGNELRTLALNSGVTGRGLALSKSKPAVLESLPRKDLRAESTRFSLCAEGLKSKRPTAMAVNLANLEQATVDEKACFRG